MDEADWATAQQTFQTAANDLATLAACLDVHDYLSTWRSTREELAGVLAADALDQAEGLLVELADGGASSLLETVRSARQELPPSAE